MAEPSPATTAHRNQTLDCRSFWRAGAYEVPSSRAPQDTLESSDFDRARVNPKFLHSNATSHKWAFGAIAELLDNAVDEICNGASFVIVDKINNPKDNSAVLLFQDDGGGMDPQGVRLCMSLGFSSKKSKKTIGQYGNGFKTSTMRLGADAILFTRAGREGRLTQSVGLLSYTFLRRTMKDDIIVPMVDFQLSDDQVIPIIYTSQDDWNSSLTTILDWSPFSSKEELLLQFKDIGPHGTKVLIYNLWMNDDGLLELDFDDDDEDILLRDYANIGGPSRFRKQIVESHISHTFRYSLRAYISILYYRKFSKFKIFLRGKPVQQVDIVNEMKFTKVRTYKPNIRMGSEDVMVKTTIGFAKEAPVLGIFGFNVYHKNRLIMKFCIAVLEHEYHEEPFWKVLQEGSSRGRSVLGVLEANFIEPAHDKQDFERTPLFIRLEAKLKQMVLEYWKDNCHLIGYQPMNAEMRNRQKESDKISHGVAPNKHQDMPGGQCSTDVSVDVQEDFHTEESVIGLAADFQIENLDAEHNIRLAAANVVPTSETNGQSSITESSVLRQDFEEIDSVDFLDSTSIEKLSEENIQLFIRRGELQTKEEELKQTIEELECNLEDTRRKCSQLASQLEIRRKQQPPG